MKEQINVLKLGCLAGVIAMVSVGCASSGHARVGTPGDSVGASGQMEVGSDADADVDMDVDNDMDLDDDSLSDSEASASSTVSALSFAPVTQTHLANRFTHDWNTRLRVIEFYTFQVPDDSVNVESDLPSFSANLPAGSAYVEAAGGSGEKRGYRVIRHSPTPTR